MPDASDCEREWEEVLELLVAALLVEVFCSGKCKFLRSISKLMSDTKSLKRSWGNSDNFCLAWFRFGWKVSLGSKKSGSERSSSILRRNSS